MGSWNGTCMLSNLPIMEGDRCKLFFLEENPHAQSKRALVYPCALYKIFSFPITGYYNDYGALKKVQEDVFSKFFVEKFNQLIGEGTIHLDPQEVELSHLKTETIEDIILAVERGAVNVIDKTLSPEQRITKLSFCLILDDVLCDATGVMQELKETEEYVNEFKENFDQTWKVCQELENSINHGKHYLLSACGIEISVGSCFSYRAKKIIFEDFLLLCLKNNFKTHLMLEAIRMKLLVQFLSCLRKILLPVTHCGSQQDNWDLHASFNDKVAGYALKKNKKRHGDF